MQDAVNSHLDYKTKFLTAKLRYEKNFPDTDNTSRSGAQSVIMPVPAANNAPFKKPTMELVKFDGSVGEWLPFWSHFKHYDEDDSIKKVDKLRYLKMSMIKDSKADRMINNYPTTAGIATRRRYKI